MSKVIQFPNLISLRFERECLEAVLIRSKNRETLKNRARRIRQTILKFAIAKHAALLRKDFPAHENYTQRIHRLAARYGRIMNKLHEGTSTNAAPTAA